MTVETIDQNPSRPQTRMRDVAKWVLWRTLPESAYQKLLARTKAKDFQSGLFREPELDLIPLLLEEGGTAVDVGANHGMWTLALSERAGAGGRVLAFEPVPFTFGTLEALTARLDLGNVRLENVGCSDETGTFEMVIPAQDVGSSDDLQAHLSARDELGEADGETVACEVVRLDDAAADLESIDFMKLDIEGAELKALTGARGVIGRHLPAIVCEVNQEFLEGFGQSADELFGYMKGFGYHAFHYKGDMRLDPLDSLDSIHHSNVVFIPEDRLDRVRGLIS